MSKTQRFVIDVIYAFLGIVACIPLACGMVANILIGVIAICIGRFIFR